MDFAFKINLDNASFRDPDAALSVEEAARVIDELEDEELDDRPGATDELDEATTAREEHDAARGAEIARILRRLADEIEGSLSDGESGHLMDHNGNRIGNWSIG